MRVCVFHNAYRERGGEDAVVEQELELLQAAGVEARLTLRHNGALESRLSRAAALVRSPHDPTAYREVRAALAEHRAEVGHVHNWFPRFSPALFRAHHDAGVPLVATLHNFRLGCARGTQLRDGAACRECSPGRALPALRRGCYRGSRVATLAWAAAVRVAQARGDLRATTFVAPSETVRAQHVAWGFPAERIHVIPNTCPDPWAGGAPAPYDPAGPVLFAGRLVPEKGVDVLLEAWRGLERPLWIVGTGPEEAALRAQAADLPQVRFCGFQAPQALRELMQRASLVVHPHRWDEPFGLVVLEAMAAGRPVLASDQGGPRDLIAPGRSGWTVAPGDPAALARALREVLDDPRGLRAAGRVGRARYEARFRPEVHAQALVELYAEVAAAPRRLPRCAS